LLLSNAEAQLRAAYRLGRCVRLTVPARAAPTTTSLASAPGSCSVSLCGAWTRRRARQRERAHGTKDPRRSGAGLARGTVQQARPTRGGATQRV